ncbi:MAG TPA: 50S ribosomal protein L4 [Thermoguttaceae bacterium]|nr:50S ribosomal protein L4 [Thermoguttaceae bacterium]
MVSLPVYDRNGAKVGDYEVDPAEFAASINKQLLHDVVVMYQANLRQGSARNKNRTDVAGTTKKMYRQKGTGNARAGSRRSNIRVGGGRAFAKRPRDFSYRLPRKAVQLATRMAVASKVADQRVTLIDRLSFTAPKTKEMAAVLKALKIGQQSLLVATENYDVNAVKSIRNLAGVSVLPVSDLNALAVLRPRRILMSVAAMDSLRRGAAQREAS